MTQTAHDLGNGMDYGLVGGDGDKSVVEALFQELGGKVTREQVQSALMAAHAHFHDATVRTYLPILIRRYVLDRLSCLLPCRFCGVGIEVPWGAGSIDMSTVFSFMTVRWSAADQFEVGTHHDIKDPA